MYELDNDTGGIGELEFFDNPIFELLSELDNDTGGIGELEFFGNPKFELLYELDNDTGGLGELEFFGNPRFELLYELDKDTGGIGEQCSQQLLAALLRLHQLNTADNSRYSGSLWRGRNVRVVVSVGREVFFQ